MQEEEKEEATLKLPDDRLIVIAMCGDRHRPMEAETHGTIQRQSPVSDWPPVGY
ncbi:uncharacterized protein LDX57_005915 [Aspergillus melleus]|uniref:uncharacterized protein n=1 Tax=Aspergillus melleus TaxID=138277 RepID=UPI001E8CC064|nr:uncharacterized protein LDX57_005915 [Aspergillus melleus]KAH8428212.1 hypothetical protein LDX57_005915 [Aspergillus melleus]